MSRRLLGLLDGLEHQEASLRLLAAESRYWRKRTVLIILWKAG